MKINHKITLLMGLVMGAPSAVAAQDSDSTSLSDQTLNEVVVTHRQTVRTMGGAINGKSMMKQELFKAACCNLGELCQQCVGGCQLYRCYHRCEADQAPRAQWYIRADACREPSRLSRSRYAVWVGLCARLLDEQHTGLYW